MMEYQRITDYCDQYYINQLEDSRLGLKLAIIGFALFVYADIFVFKYPAIVTIFRSTLIGYFILALLCTYVFEGARKLLKVIISVSMMLSLLFGSFIALYMGKIVPDFYYRASQVLLLVMIGSILFSGIVKPYLGYLLALNLIVYLIGAFYVYGVSVEVFYQHFNVVFVNICCIIFNYYFIRSRVYEYEAIELKNRKIDELKSEIIVRQKLQYQLKEMATYDGLTNAYTRAVGLGMLEKQMLKADHDYKSLSIIYLDVNGLKIINDTYGHKIGDMYIVGLVEIINKLARHKDFCIRLGGDEFLLVLPNTTIFEAEQIWRIINDEIAKFEFDYQESIMPLQVSHGLAEYVDHNYPSVDHFLEIADDKMYREKKGIKNIRIEEYVKSYTRY